MALRRACQPTPAFVRFGWMDDREQHRQPFHWLCRIASSLEASCLRLRSSYYTTPQELVTKLWIVPGALTMVLFPHLAMQITQSDEQTGRFLRGGSLVIRALLQLSVAIMLFAHELLSLWINPEFASHSAILLRIFAVGNPYKQHCACAFHPDQSAGAIEIDSLGPHRRNCHFFLGVLCG